MRSPWTSGGLESASRVKPKLGLKPKKGLVRRKDRKNKSLPDSDNSVCRKKRGRNLFSKDLENFLVDRIHKEINSGGDVDRIWITKQAKTYITKNEVNLKCSKGWLDKFMKRNEQLIKQSDIK